MFNKAGRLKKIDIKLKGNHIKSVKHYTYL